MLGYLKEATAQTALEKQIQELNLRLAAQEKGRNTGYIIAGIFLFIKLISR
jgi:hypothetical protein